MIILMNHSVTLTHGQVHLIHLNHDDCHSQNQQVHGESNSSSIELQLQHLSQVQPQYEFNHYDFILILIQFLSQLLPPGHSPRSAR